MTRPTNQSQPVKRRPAKRSRREEQVGPGCQAIELRNVMELLPRKGGASLKRDGERDRLQKHFVRGFLAGSSRKQHGLVVTSEKTGDGRVYQVVEDAQQ